MFSQETGLILLRRSRLIGSWRATLTHADKADSEVVGFLQGRQQMPGTPSKPTQLAPFTVSPFLLQVVVYRYRERPLVALDVLGKWKQARG